MRPPDIHVGGLIFYRDSSSSFFLVFATCPPSSLNGTQLISATWSEVSAIWKHMSKIWGIPSPYKSGAPFWRLRNLGQLKRPIFSEWNMTYISGQVRCKLQGVSYNVSERHKLWSTNGFKLELSFHPPSVNVAFYFIARLRRRRSANTTQTNFVKGSTVNGANNLQ